jgi:hypothetical protein
MEKRYEENSCLNIHVDFYKHACSACSAESESVGMYLLMSLIKRIKRFD